MQRQSMPTPFRNTIASGCLGTRQPIANVAKSLDSDNSRVLYLEVPVESNTSTAFRRSKSVFLPVCGFPGSFSSWCAVSVSTMLLLLSSRQIELEIGIDETARVFRTSNLRHHLVCRASPIVGSACKTSFNVSDGRTPWPRKTRNPFLDRRETRPRKLSFNKETVLSGVVSPGSAG